MYHNLLCTKEEKDVMIINIIKSQSIAKAIMIGFYYIIIMEK
jgi:hypothetical protein